MYGTADGVDPDKAQHTGADHGDQSRCQGMAKATHGTAADLVSGGQKFQCGDDQKALYGKVRTFGSVVYRRRKKSRPSTKIPDNRPQNITEKSCRDGILFAPLKISGTVILARKSNGSLGKCVYHKIRKNSKFSAAADPAIAFEPKLLIMLWMQTLAREKTMPCRPAGTPMIRIFSVRPSQWTSQRG